MKGSAVRSKLRDQRLIGVENLKAMKALFCSTDDMPSHPLIGNEDGSALQATEENKNQFTTGLITKAD